MGCRWTWLLTASWNNALIVEEVRPKFTMLHLLMPSVFVFKSSQLWKNWLEPIRRYEFSSERYLSSSYMPFLLCTITGKCTSGNLFIYHLYLHFAYWKLLKHCSIVWKGRAPSRHSAPPSCFGLDRLTCRSIDLKLHKFRLCNLAVKLLYEQCKVE